MAGKDIISFELDLDRFADRTVPEAVGMLRNAIALEVLTGVVMMTPVDTGRARGNWQTTAGKPAEGYIEYAINDKSGGRTIGKGMTVLKSTRDPYRPIWLHNGVPYIVHLNNGTPRMTAVHMVEATVERVQRHFGGAT